MQKEPEKDVELPLIKNPVKKRNKKIIFLIGAILISIILVVAGLLFYNYFSGREDLPVIPVDDSDNGIIEYTGYQDDYNSADNITNLTDNEQQGSSSSSSGSSGGSGRHGCTETCNSLGFECGIQTVCESNVNCGNCETNEFCSSGKCIEIVFADFYADNNLIEDCNGTYSIINRDCSGRDGVAYNTIQEAADKLKPGNLLLIRGGTYREQVTLTKAGNATHKITVSGYPREEAIINAADEITGWKKCENAAECYGNPNWQNIYYKDTGFEITQLFQNGVRLKLSRYPEKNAGINNSGWNFPISNSSINPRDIFYDTRLNGFSDDYFNGSTCHIKTKQWMENRIKVKNFVKATGEISLASLTSYDISTEFGYYFTNLVPEINEAGEWAYQNDRIYLYPVAGILTEIAASKRDYGIYITSSSGNVTIKNMKIKYANHTGIYSGYSGNNEIDTNTIEYSNFAGILATSSRNITVINNTIQYSGNRGIYAAWLSHNVTIDYNTISDTGASKFGDDMPIEKDFGFYGAGMAILTDGTIKSISHNRIDRAAYSGIELYGNGSGGNVSYNHITNVGLSLTDGGGIYTWGWHDPVTRKYDYIMHNIVSDIYGYVGGRAGFNASLPNHFAGIYMDEEANDYEIRENTVYNCPYLGIFLHWAPDIVIDNNKAYGCASASSFDAGMYISGYNQLDNIPEKDDPYTRMAKGTTVTRNTVFSTSANQDTFMLYLHNYSDIDFGYSNNNKFLNPFKPEHIRSVIQLSRVYNIYRNLTNWTEFSGFDANSQDWNSFVSSAPCVVSTNSTIIVNPSMGNKDFALPEGSWTDTDGNLVSGSANLEPFDSKILVKCVGNPVPIFNADYYVDGSLQNDCTNYDVSSRSCGTGNKIAYNTIQEAADKLKPGNLLLVRDGTYRESVEIKVDGSENAPITIKNYGSEEVIVDGSQPLSGWMPCTQATCPNNPNWQNMYYTSITWNTTKLFENQEVLVQAREPDFGYYNSTKGLDNRTLYSSVIDKGPDYYIGANIELQGTSTTSTADRSNLLFDRFKVDIANIGIVHLVDTMPAEQYSNYYSSPFNHPPMLNEMWFYLRNKIQYIDRPGEWAIDYSSSPYRIYLWPKNGNPNNNLIEVPKIGNGFFRLHSATKYIVFDGFEVRKTNNYYGAEGWFSGAYAFHVGTEGVTVKNSKIHESRNGVYMVNPNGVKILNNTIYSNDGNIALRGVGQWPIFSVNMSYVENNEIGPGYGDGIWIGNVGNVTFRNNHIHHHRSDRTHTDGIQSSSSVKYLYIENNTIHDSMQNIIIENASYVSLKNNLIYYTEGGRSIIFFANPGSKVDVLEYAGNTFGYSSHQPYIEFSNTIMKNNFYGFSNKEGVLWMPATEKINKSNTNYFYDNYKNITIPKSGYPTYSLAQWQAFGYDINSIFGGSNFTNAPLGDYKTEYFGTPEVLIIVNAGDIFKIGDYVEYGNDEVLRRVTKVNQNNITIDPPLPLDNIGSYWGKYLKYWGSNSNIKEDFRPNGGPACSGSDSGSYIGALPCAEGFQGLGDKEFASMKAATGFWSKTISFFKSFFGLTGKSIESITGNFIFWR